MNQIASLIKVLGGISFGAVLLSIYVIAPLGLLALVFNQPLLQLASPFPVTASVAVLLGGFIAIGFLAAIAYGLIALFNR